MKTSDHGNTFIEAEIDNGAARDVEQGHRHLTVGAFESSVVS